MYKLKKYNKSKIMKSFILCAVTCLSSTYLMAQDSKLISPIPQSYEDFPDSKATHTGMKVRTIPKNLPQTNYKHNVKYITRDGLDLTLQIIKPKNAKGKLPCIVYVQGSAWFKQDVYGNIPQLAEFAKRGYIIAVVEYRPSTVAKFPAQLQDTKTAIRFMRKNAETYGVDTNNIFVWGDSSGGHTALMVGLTQNNAELDTEDYKDFGIKVNGIIDFYGPTDISQMNFAPSTMDHTQAKTPEGMLIGGKNVLENVEEAAKTNPINYLKDLKNAAPILILHGSKDRLVPFQQSVLLADALKKGNFAYEFYQLKGADHGSSEFWTNKIFDIVENFLKANLHKKTSRN
jgi:acetyl esterase/lipase